MEFFEVFETEQFKLNLEDAAFWLYLHHVEQSQDFADKKFLDLEQEINSLKNNLRKNPFMGQMDVITGIRRFPVYNGRYQLTWVVNEHSKSIILLEFLDSKYPEKLRGFYFDEE